MKTSFLIAGGLALSLLGTGCATKKYVAKSIAPVEQRVTSAEAKNTDQDTKIAANATQIDGVDKDLSRTKERLNDVDATGGRYVQNGYTCRLYYGRRFADWGVNDAHWLGGAGNYRNHLGDCDRFIRRRNS